MAKTALLVSIYGGNGQGFGSTMGSPMSFPTGNIVIRTIPPTNYQGVTCNAAIQLLPTGLQVNSPQFYVAETVGSLVTTINS